MTTYAEIVEKIQDDAHREKYESAIQWLKDNYPNFKMTIKWSQPCFEQDGTFIIGFKPTKKYFTVTGEKGLMEQVADKAVEAGYEITDMTVKILWDEAIDYDLIKEMIAIQLEDKKDLNKYWR